MNVRITLDQKTLERLNHFRSDGESIDTVINILIDYIGFHSDEFKDSGSWRSSAG